MAAVGHALACPALYRKFIVRPNSALKRSKPASTPGTMKRAPPVTPTLKPIVLAFAVLADGGKLSSTFGGIVNCPALAFSTQKNATPGEPAWFGTDAPRISTVAPASTPDQLTVTPWLRCT